MLPVAKALRRKVRADARREARAGRLGGRQCTHKCVAGLPARQALGPPQDHSKGKLMDLNYFYNLIVSSCCNFHCKTIFYNCTQNIVQIIYKTRLLFASDNISGATRVVPLVKGDEGTMITYKIIYEP